LPAGCGPGVTGHAMDAESAKENTIIIIDDDETMRLACEKILTKSGYAIETFPDGFSGIERIKEFRPGLIVVDLKMPGISGIEVIEQVREFDPDIVIVVITGYATVGSAVEAMKAGAYDFLPKPFTPDELRLIIRRAMERRRLTMVSVRLQREKELLERRFITMVSHQLQTPLAAVQQYLDVLLHLMDEGQPTEHYREWLEKSRGRVVELLSIIQDWLTLSKVEHGALASGREAVAVVPIIERLRETFQERAADRRVDVELRLAENLPPVAGDEECLSMVFSNLLVNAIKYNKDGGRVVISGREERGRVIVDFTDTGIGIAEENVPKLFTDFFRVRDATTSGIKGTGLGLSIGKRIVEELSGNISVKSTLGEGSTFTVTLPVFKPEEHQNERVVNADAT